MSQNVFVQDKFPYVLTLLFGLVGWGVTHVVDRLISSPIIEYSIEERQLGPIRSLTYEVTNITPATLFEKIEFLLIIEDTTKGKIIHAAWFFPPPIKMEKDAENFESDQMRARYPVGTLHPRWSVFLTVQISGTATPSLRFSSNQQAVRLVERSFQTFLVRREIAVILFLVAVWSLLIIAYLIMIVRRPSNDTSDPETEE